MDDLISRKALLHGIVTQRHLRKSMHPKQSFVVGDVIWCINNAPAVEAEPVKHGRWEKRKAIVFDDEMVGYRCSNCNTTWDAETNYCPNCGADMRERKDNGNVD